MRTADDVIKDWQVAVSGRTRSFPAIPPRDDEIMLAEVLRLRAENADMRGELVDYWSAEFYEHSASKWDDEWRVPYFALSKHAAAQLHKLGLVEKHPDREAYRFIQKGGE